MLAEPAGIVIHSRCRRSGRVRVFRVRSQAVTTAATRRTGPSALLLPAALLVLAGCGGAPEASGTLPPLPSAATSASPSASEVPVATPNPSASGQPDPSDVPTGTPSPSPTPTATPTAPVPDGLTAAQLEAAAFVEEYHVALGEAVDRGDVSFVGRLQAPDCPCRAVLPVLEDLVAEEARREGADLVVLRFEQVTGASDRVDLVFEIDEQQGAYVFPDGSRSQVMAAGGTDRLVALRTPDGWQVGGIESLTDQDA